MSVKTDGLQDKSWTQDLGTQAVIPNWLWQLVWRRTWKQ